MSGDQLDLDALDAAYALGGRPTLSEGIALVAEVRRMRALIDSDETALLSAESVEYLTSHLEEYRGRMRTAEAEVTRLRALVARSDEVRAEEWEKRVRDGS